MKAIVLTTFPSSAFFFRIVPEIGARIVQLSSRHFALATSASAWRTSARALSMRSIRGPSSHQFQGEPQPLDAAEHGPIVAVGHFEVLLGDGLSRDQFPRPLPFRLQLHELRFGLVQLGSGLGDFLGPVATLQFEQNLLGGFQRGDAMFVVGAVVGVFQFRQDIALFHPNSLLDGQADDHPVDLRADEDLVDGDDITFALQSDVAGTCRLRGQGSIGRRGRGRRGRRRLRRRPRRPARFEEINRRSARRQQPENPDCPPKRRAFRRLRFRQVQGKDPLAEPFGRLALGRGRSQWFRKFRGLARAHASLSRTRWGKDLSDSIMPENRRRG